ncbi:hypothetical protein ACOXVJ_16990 [Pseudomonas knackmussii]|uniref:hypothetical protein n=1 Tax=Pseudomonas knackmussii TaxID=65741 RepID=UPI003BEB5025
MDDVCDRQRLMAESVAAHQRLLEFLHRVTVPITPEQRCEFERLICEAASAHRTLTDLDGRTAEITY